MTIAFIANEYCSRQSSSSSSNPVMVSVNNEEPGIAMSEEHQQQFIQMNPGSVIQRVRTVPDEGASGYVYPTPFLLQPHQQQEAFGNHLPPPGAYGMGAILPSPGSCSDSGLSIEGEKTSSRCQYGHRLDPSYIHTGDYGALNANGTNMDSSGRITSAGNGSNIHLWQFLRELLEQQDKYGQCVRWIDQNAGKRSFVCGQADRCLAVLYLADHPGCEERSDAFSQLVMSLSQNA